MVLTEDWNALKVGLEEPIWSLKFLVHSKINLSYNRKYGGKLYHLDFKTSKFLAKILTKELVGTVYPRFTTIKSDVEVSQQTKNFPFQYFF